MKILITEPVDISQEAIDLLNRFGHETVTNINQHTDSTISGLLVRTYTQVKRELLDRFPSLTAIIRVGTGLDNIDLKECAQRNIQVFNSPGANSNSVAEHALSMILMLLKNTNKHIENVRQDVWRTRLLLGSELRGKRVGLIGCGAVGQKIAKLLSAFEVEIIGYDKYANPKVLHDLYIKPISLSNLIKISDIICVQVPLTSETKNILSTKQFLEMKDSCYIINVSRGEVINENALIHALSKNRIAGAAIDVVVGEPYPNPRLFSLPNLVITPHIAGYTIEADKAMAIEAVKNFLIYNKRKI